jgi:hypothetical protein
MFLSDEEIRIIEDAFLAIDFDQPHAHEVYHVIHNAMVEVAIDIKNTKNREFRFFALGSAYGEANQKYLTTPPIRGNKNE